MFKIFYVVLIIFFISSCKEEKSTANKVNDTVNTNHSIKTDTNQKPADTNSVKNSQPKDTIKKITFKEFANEFVKEAFKSEENFSKYTESTFIVSSSDEESRSNKKTNSQKQYEDMKRYRIEYNKYSINKDMIYFYENLEDFKIGMKYFFRKDTLGNWKLYKVYFEGL